MRDKVPLFETIGQGNYWHGLCIAAVRSSFGFTGKLLALLALLLATGTPHAYADATFVYAVQLSAVVQTNPPQITLNWEPDPNGATNYTVYRKAKEDTSWGSPVAALPGSALSFTDTNVVDSSSYEYQVVKTSGYYTGYSTGYVGYGYIYVGIDSPLVEQRGTVVLVVATNSTAGLEDDLALLESDLVGDGWQVLRHDVSSNDTPASVQSLIAADYAAAANAVTKAGTPPGINTVFLLGHVPVLYSGYLNYDGHGARAMPADAFYGDMNNDWLIDGDPTNGPSFLPSDVKLAVGRVDFFDMPGNGAPVPWPDEAGLLHNYLLKEHYWRMGELSVQRQALVGNRFGDEGGEAFAASGYRNFEPCVGPGNTFEADVADVAPDSQRWISLEAVSSYLWSYGCGGGSDTSIGYLGTDASQFYDVHSTDIVDQDAQAVFVMLFGSHLGEWSSTDDIMRAVLATPTMGLTCCLAGRPHWFCHHMALGETIGYSTRLTMNNDTLYQNQSNLFTRAVYIALMGDPTLRLDVVTPPSGLSATTEPNSVDLSWYPSPDNVLGYYVYRAPSPAGPFVRLTDSLVNDTQWTDWAPPPGNATYMVRAVALTSHFSGSYFNASQGIFATVLAPITTPINLTAELVTNGVQLTWNTQPGLVYHIQACDDLVLQWWIDWSPSVVATDLTTSWTDTNIVGGAQLFYRVSSP